MITIKTKHISARYLGNSRWTVVGRGPRRTVTHAEMRGLLEDKRGRQQRR